jgi:hypothetical protein
MGNRMSRPAGTYGGGGVGVRHRPHFYIGFNRRRHVGGRTYGTTRTARPVATTRPRRRFGFHMGRRRAMAY